MADQRRYESQEGFKDFSSNHTLFKTPLYTIPANSRDARTDDRSITNVVAEKWKTMNAKEKEELLNRGRERFNIHCSVCHGLSGSGNGMVAVRGMVFPPSYHTDRLRQKPIQYFYEVVTHGKGKMPPYGDFIETEDRWAIATYVRTLQISQFASRTWLAEKDLVRLDSPVRWPKLDGRANL